MDLRKRRRVMLAQLYNCTLAPRTNSSRYEAVALVSVTTAL